MPLPFSLYFLPFQRDNFLKYLQVFITKPPYKNFGYHFIIGEGTTLFGERRPPLYKYLVIIIVFFMTGCQGVSRLLGN